MLNVWLKKNSLYLRVLKFIQTIKCLHKPVTSSLTLQLKLQRIRRYLLLNSAHMQVPRVGIEKTPTEIYLRMIYL